MLSDHLFCPQVKPLGHSQAPEGAGCALDGGGHLPRALQHGAHSCYNHDKIPWVWEGLLISNARREMRDILLHLTSQASPKLRPQLCLASLDDPVVPTEWPPELQYDVSSYPLHCFMSLHLRFCVSCCWKVLPTLPHLTLTSYSLSKTQFLCFPLTLGKLLRRVSDVSQVPKTCWFSLISCKILRNLSFSLVCFALDFALSQFLMPKPDRHHKNIAF